MQPLPLYIPIIFMLTSLLCIWFFFKASHRSRAVLFLLLGWTCLQAAVGFSQFYQNTTALPPRFLLLVLPPAVCILLLFVLPAGRRFLDSLDKRYLTLLHVVRIPVEIVLFWLFVHKMVPQLMTFEGRNFDILSGMSAPIVWYFGYVKKTLPRLVLLVWNFICLGLLVNIIAHGVLSAPTPFQRFAFEQPNIALIRFPYVWLPCLIVPLVMLAHLACIRDILVRERE